MAQPAGTKTSSLLQQPNASHTENMTPQGAAQQTAREALQGSASAAAISSTSQCFQAVPYVPCDTGPEEESARHSATGPSTLFLRVSIKGRNMAQPEGTELLSWLQQPPAVKVRKSCCTADNNASCARQRNGCCS